MNHKSGGGHRQYSLLPGIHTFMGASSLHLRKEFPTLFLGDKTNLNT